MRLLWVEFETRGLRKLVNHAAEYIGFMQLCLTYFTGTLRIEYWM